jgi:hypothetical protein
MLALKRLWVQVTTDKRRFGALCGVLAVGLLLWARVIIITNMPRHAVADRDAEPVAVDDGSDTTPPAIAAESVTVTLDEVPERDPFVINPTVFPPPHSLTNLEADAGKSTEEPVEDDQQAAARLHMQLQAVVDRFSLEAVMSGSIAVISGETFRPGDRVPASDNEQLEFLLVEVKNRSVILGYEDHRFELTIANPGDQ